MESKNLIIGIDGDKDKSGFSCYNKDTKELTYSAMKFFDLQRWLIENKENIHTVKIEASWLISKSNFHTSIPRKRSYTYGEVLKHSNIAAKVGKLVGCNHEVGRKIQEMCEDIGINHKLSKPLLKKWKGSGGKITHEELVQLLKPLGIEMNKRGSQDTRDAILICLY